MELVEYQVRCGNGAEIEVGLCPRQAVRAEEEAAQHLVDGRKGGIGLEARIVRVFARLDANVAGHIAIVADELVR